MIDIVIITAGWQLYKVFEGRHLHSLSLMTIEIITISIFTKGATCILGTVSPDPSAHCCPSHSRCCPEVQVIKISLLFPNEHILQDVSLVLQPGADITMWIKVSRYCHFQFIMYYHRAFLRDICCHPYFWVP